MTSDSDDLEHQLRENLKLRRELAAEVAKANQGGGSPFIGFASLYGGNSDPIRALGHLLELNACAGAVAKVRRRLQLLQAGYIALASR